MDRRSSRHRPISSVFLLNILKWAMRGKKSCFSDTRWKVDLNSDLFKGRDLLSGSLFLNSLCKRSRHLKAHHDLAKRAFKRMTFTQHERHRQALLIILSRRCVIEVACYCETTWLSWTDWVHCKLVTSYWLDRARQLLLRAVNCTLRIFLTLLECKHCW